MEQAPVSEQKQGLWQQALANPRIICILFLGFSSGLPLALTGATLQAWYTVAGVNIVTIGILSLVGQPYVFKFLWAPFMDRFRLPWLGRRRGWMISMQGLLVIGIAIMAFMHPSSSPLGLAIVALFVAFASASQDISLDAYRTDLLKPNERGLGASMNTAGYRVAMLVSGGLALVLASEIGWRSTYLIMAGLMALEMFVTYLSPNIEQLAKAPLSLREAVIDPFKEFLNRKSAIMILVFIVVYKLGDAFALSLSTTFLIRGVHFSLIDVGAIYKVVGLLATLLGVFVGGVLMLRMGLYRALMLFGILQAVSNFMFMVLAIVGKNYALMVATIGIESLCGGLATVAFVAFLMALCDHRFTATQFALLSALSAVGRVFVGPVAGVMVEHIGWAQFYFWSFIVALPGLVILRWLKSRVDFSAEKIGI